jgi:hypothetical protein
MYMTKKRGDAWSQFFIGPNYQQPWLSKRVVWDHINLPHNLSYPVSLLVNLGLHHASCSQQQPIWHSRQISAKGSCLSNESLSGMDIELDLHLERKGYLFLSINC